MLKFAALNSEPSSDSEAEDGAGQTVRTREAQEGQAAALYREALAELAADRTTDGVAKLRQLLKTDYVNEEDSGDFQGTGTMPTSLQLKYLALKNAGEAYLKLDKLRKAAKYFVKAMLIDGRDLPTWLKVGDIGFQLLNLQLARSAYEMAVQLKDTHWPAVDRLISLTYIVGDYAHTLDWCRRSLAGGSRSSRAIVLADRIFEENPFLIERYPLAYRTFVNALQTCNIAPEESAEILEQCEQIRNERKYFQDWLDERERKAPQLKFRKIMTERTWLQLGETLQVHYDNIAKTQHPGYLLERLDFEQAEAVRSPVERRRFRVDSSSEDEQDATTREPDDSQQANKDSDGDLKSRGSGFDYKRVDPEENSDSQLNELAMLIGDNTPTDSLLDDLGISIEESRSQRRKRVFQDFISNNKRRSARNRQGGKKTVDLSVNYRDLLIPFLPTSIFAEVPVVEDERASGSQHKAGQPNSHRCQHIHPSKIIDLSEDETNEVTRFIEKNRNCPALTVMIEYLIALVQRDERRWPSELKGVFMGLYERVRHNYQRPDDMDESRTDELINWAWVELNVCELFFERYVSDNTRMDQVLFDERFPLNEFVEAIGFVCRQTHRRMAFGGRWQVYAARAFHLEACFYMRYGDIDMARHRLEQVSVVMERAKLFECTALTDDDCSSEAVPQVDCVRVVNLKQNNLISAKEAAQILDGIDRLRHLEDLASLYDLQQYDKVVSLITETFKVDRRSIQARTSVLPRHEQLLLLFSTLKKLGNDRNTLHWMESSIHECLNQYVRASCQTMKSAWSKTTVKLIDGTYELVEEKSSDVFEGLSVEKMSRFAHTLIKIISLQMDLRESVDNMAIPTVLSWNLLYKIVKHEEDKVVMEKSTDSAMPSSLLMMFTAHEYLGKRNWCMRNDGAFVFLCVRVMTEEMVKFREALGSHPFEEDLTAGLEQCFHCLFGTDKDKAKRKGQLQDHNVKPLKLTWDHAKYVFTFYKPIRLPEFDSYSMGISTEAESLFRRIASLIPAESNPAACADRMAIYIESSSAGSMPQMASDCADKELISELYYLLGDFYFKNRDFVKASRYYMLDSCINPHRIDSWAGMALSRSAQIEQRLNSCELKGEGPQLLKRTDGALFCFQKALDLAPANASLWIECGSCAYSVVSFLCRQMKLRKALELSPETVAEFKRKKVEYLNMAKKCYTEAIRCELEGSGNDELWLCHYMLSKITHKMGEPLEVYMEHISRAAQNLYEMEARYPKKIIYQAPPHLSIEALEMHYKIHAFAAKFLIRNQLRQISPAELQILERHLREAGDGHFARHRERLKEASGAVAEADDSDAGSRTPKRGRPPKNKDQNKEKKNEDSAAPQAVRRSSRKRPASQEEVASLLGILKAKQFRSNSQEEAENDIVAAVVDELLSAVDAALEKERRYRDMSEYDSVLECLLNYCIDAFRECIFRFSAHFKSVYHMANLYFRYKRHRDAGLALDYLMGKQSRPPKLCTQGLFAERRASCLFQGVWHIPADEIDRPGSFATHLYRAARLVQLVATHQTDHETLIQIGLMLAKTPDIERKYIRDFDRTLVSRTAFKEGLRIIEERFSSLMNEEPPPPEKTLVTGLVDIYRVWQQCTKAGSYIKEIEAAFKESYTLFKLGEVDSAPSVVDQAASFCSKYLAREARKEKLAQQEAQRMAKLRQEMAARAVQEAAKQAEAAAQHAQLQAIREQFDQQQALIEEMEKAAEVSTANLHFSTSAGAHPQSRVVAPRIETAHRRSSTSSPVEMRASDSLPAPQRTPMILASTAAAEQSSPRKPSSPPQRRGPNTAPLSVSVGGISVDHVPSTRSPPRTSSMGELGPPMSPTVASSMGVMALLREFTKETTSTRISPRDIRECVGQGEKRTGLTIGKDSGNTGAPSMSTIKLPATQHFLEGLAADIPKNLIGSTQQKTHHDAMPLGKRATDDRAGGSSNSSLEPDSPTKTSFRSKPLIEEIVVLSSDSSDIEAPPSNRTPSGVPVVKETENRSSREHIHDFKARLGIGRIVFQQQRVLAANSKATGLQSGDHREVMKAVVAAAAAAATTTTAAAAKTATIATTTTTAARATVDNIVTGERRPTADRPLVASSPPASSVVVVEQVSSGSESDCVVVEPVPLPTLARQLQSILPKGVTLTRCSTSVGSTSGGGGGSASKKDRGHK